MGLADGTRGWCQFHVSQLRALSRHAAQAGTSIELAASSGDNLEETDRLYFSHPGITGELRQRDPLPFRDERRPDYGHFTVNVDAAVPPGRYEVRVGGRHGVSNPLAFLVTPFVANVAASVSHQAEMPTPLPLNALLQARSTAADVDFYSIDVDEGQSLRIDLLAQRLDSSLIGQINVHDPSGRVVAAARGADDVDPVVLLEGLPAGQYRVTVHDFLYRGGEEFHYQIVAQPSASAVDLIANASGGEGQLPRVCAIEACTVLEHDAISVPGESAGSQSADAEEAAGGEEFEVPGTVTRWFAENPTDSLFEFAAGAGRRFAIDVVSHRLGEATDPRLILQRVEPQSSTSPKLHDIANADDGQNVGDAAVHLRTRDPGLLFQAPVDATYRLIVRDLDVGRTLSPRQKYELRIRDPNPGFDLVAYRPYPHRDANQSQAFATKLFRGGSESIRVFALRRDGWTGPIRIVVEDLPDGVQAKEVIIAAGQDQTQLTLTAAEDAPFGVHRIRVVGHSDDGAIVQEACPATIVRGRGGGREFIRSRLSTGWIIAVSEVDLSPLTITLGGDDVAEVKKGENLVLPVQLTRRAGGNAACVLRPRDLPPGVTVGEVTVAADKAEASVELKVTPAASAGTYSLWLQGETKIKVKPNPQALQRAQHDRAHLQSLHDDPAQAEHLESIKLAISEADKLVEASKASANEQESTVFIPTSNATFRVVDP